MEPYWSYEDIGVFLFVLVFLAAAVGLSVRILIPAPIRTGNSQPGVAELRHHFPERLTVPDSQVASSPAR